MVAQGGRGGHTNVFLDVPLAEEIAPEPSDQYTTNLQARLWRKRWSLNHRLQFAQLRQHVGFKQLAQVEERHVSILLKMAACSHRLS